MVFAYVHSGLPRQKGLTGTRSCHGSLAAVSQLTQRWAKAAMGKAGRTTGGGSTPSNGSHPVTVATGKKTVADSPVRLLWATFVLEL